MNVDCFLDTNVLVYAALGRFSDPAKYERARLLMGETNFGLSGQVLQEFLVTVTRKADRNLTTEQAMEWLDALTDRPCTAVDRELVVEAARIAERYKISYWDGAVVAAAARLSAPMLYSEDLNHGQDYGSVRVVNPFRTH